MALHNSWVVMWLLHKDLQVLGLLLACITCIYMYSNMSLLFRTS